MDCLLCQKKLTFKSEKKKLYMYHHACYKQMLEDDVPRCKCKKGFIGKCIYYSQCKNRATGCYACIRINFINQYCWPCS